MNEETNATNNVETPDLADKVDTLPMYDVKGDAPVDNEQCLDEGDESGSFDNEPSAAKTMMNRPMKKMN